MFKRKSGERVSGETIRKKKLWASETKNVGKY